jgi:hypothetical protein
MDNVGDGKSGWSGAGKALLQVDVPEKRERGTSTVLQEICWGASRCGQEVAEEERGDPGAVGKFCSLRCMICERPFLMDVPSALTPC